MIYHRVHSKDGIDDRYSGDNVELVGPWSISPNSPIYIHDGRARPIRVYGLPGTYNCGDSVSGLKFRIGLDASYSHMYPGVSQEYTLTYLEEFRNISSTSRCGCGARHTSFPNGHYEWCKEFRWNQNEKQNKTDYTW